jgi:hypothetical protein
MLFGHCDYVKITRFSTIKILLSCRLSTGASFVLFMIVSTACGESQPVYGGVYTVEGHN